MAEDLADIEFVLKLRDVAFTFFVPRHHVLQGVELARSGLAHDVQGAAGSLTYQIEDLVSED